MAGEVRRSTGLDAARGAAVVAMVAYHLSWDLAYTGLVTWDVTGDPAWRWFARAIAGSFLVLVGIGLVLSDRAGHDVARKAGRVLKIAAAAALVTVGTYAAFPDAFVFFGILHMIAVGSVLALPLVRAPVAVVILVAAAALALPQVATSEVFAAPLLLPLGLAPSVPPTNDYVPIFPWIAPLLLGVAIGRLLPGRGEMDADAPPSPAAAPLRWLALVGRWSLVVYLVHQPLLFGAVSGAAALIPVDPAVERAHFTGSCTAECSRAGSEPALCTRFCGCVSDALAGTGIFESREQDPTTDSLVAAAAGSCQGTIDHDLREEEDEFDEDGGAPAVPPGSPG